MGSRSDRTAKRTKRRLRLGLFLSGMVGATWGHASEEKPFHFDFDVAPHLAKAGCAAADCHGGATGRGGFKLSLFATNPRADYRALTEELDGRRIDLREPKKSLLLRKPTRQLKHKGGKVIDEDSEAYRALSAWIAQGAPYARGVPEKVEKLSLVREGDQVKVMAFFLNEEGARRAREVTGMARFESTNERVVSVEGDGKVTEHGSGRAWILAHYGLASARLAISRPFDEKAFLGRATGPQHQFDAVWRATLIGLGLESAPPAPKHQYLRRLALDLVGRPPTLDEIQAFEEDAAATVERLLESKEFVEQWTRHLSEWFEIPPATADLRHTRERNGRLRSRVRTFVTSKEGNLRNFARAWFTEPAKAEFVARFGDPRDRAEFVGRSLLGISLGCARCHNHPQDRWSQADHLQFSALFADARPGKVEGTMNAGTFFLPGDGKPVRPALLSLAGKTVPLDSKQSHGEQLASFLQEDASEAFARNAANRIVGILLGQHLVDAPDDHRLSNPSVHGGVLLHHLAISLEEGEFRLRPFIRYVVDSQLYRASTEPMLKDVEGRDHHVRYWARREARPLEGDAYLRAVAAVLGVPQPQEAAPETPLADQLHRLNGGLLQQWLRSPGNQVDAIFEFQADARKQLEELYLLTLSRPPRKEEQKAFLSVLSKAEDPLVAGRDLALALLLSREFSSVR